jgi:hypothetical protein
MSITRLSEATAYGTNAGRFAVTSILNSSLIVTPAITASSTLKLIVWRADNAGSIVRVADSGDLGGNTQITGVACPATSPPGSVCTVFRRASGEFGATVWTVDPVSGACSVATSGVYGDPVGWLDAEAAGSALVSVARNRFGTLRLQARKTSGLGVLATAQDSAVATVGHPVMGESLVTPVIEDCSSTLKLIAWRIGIDGSITRAGDSGAHGGKATSVAAATIGGKWASAARVGVDHGDQPSAGLGGIFNGHLQVTFWDHLAGGSFSRLGSGVSPFQVLDADATGLDYNEIGFGDAKARYRVVVAARTRDARLRLMIWSWSPNASTAVLDEDSGDQAEKVSFLRLHSIGNDLFVTVVRDDTPDANGNPLHRLKLVSWRIQ